MAGEGANELTSATEDTMPQVGAGEGESEGAMSASSGIADTGGPAADDGCAADSPATGGGLTGGIADADGCAGVVCGPVEGDLASGLEVDPASGLEVDPAGGIAGACGCEADGLASGDIAAADGGPTGDISVADGPAVVGALGPDELLLRAFFSDESEAFRTPSEPALGEVVTVRLRVERPLDVRATVLVGAVPSRVPMRRVREDALFTWHEAQFTCGLEPIGYHFLVEPFEHSEAADDLFAETFPVGAGTARPSSEGGQGAQTSSEHSNEITGSPNKSSSDDARAALAALAEVSSTASAGSKSGCLPVEGDETRSSASPPPEATTLPRAVTYQRGGARWADEPLLAERDFRIVPGFSTPTWAKGALQYQIFPDRFANGDPANDVVNREYAYNDSCVRHVADWDAPPAGDDYRCFYGGDLRGVMDKLDYLQSLGVEAIYLNPIFVSPSSHKYDTQDYGHIDPHLGCICDDLDHPLADGDLSNRNALQYVRRTTSRANLEASDALFAELCQELHRRGMRIILDGVFNHCGSFNPWMDREGIYERAGIGVPGAYRRPDSPFRRYFRFDADGDEGVKWPDNGWPGNGGSVGGRWRERNGCRVGISRRGAASAGAEIPNLPADASDGLAALVPAADSLPGDVPDDAWPGNAWIGDTWPGNGDPGDGNHGYEAWWGFPTLPKLNYESSPELCERILDVARHWALPPYSIDGWRLDVAADLGYSEEFNHVFWRRFRSDLKRVNPELLILAEHYGDCTAWLAGDQWDSVMNYDAFMDPLTYFLTGMEKHSDARNDYLYQNGAAFCETMRANMARFGWGSALCAMNELSNHDHSRFLTRTNRTVGRTESAGPEAAGEGVDKRVLREAVVVQMTWPGAPTIYYGDEAGQVGWTDPDCRRTFPWGAEDAGLVELHRALAALRRERPALREGSFVLLGGGEGWFAFGRFLCDDRIVVVCNNADVPQRIAVRVRELGVPDGCEMHALLQTTPAAGAMPEAVLAPAVGMALGAGTVPEAIATPEADIALGTAAVPGPVARDADFSIEPRNLGVVHDGILCVTVPARSALVAIQQPWSSA